MHILQCVAQLLFGPKVTVTGQEGGDLDVVYGYGSGYGYGSWYGYGCGVCMDMDVGYGSGYRNLFDTVGPLSGTKRRFKTLSCAMPNN